MSVLDELVADAYRRAGALPADDEGTAPRSRPGLADALRGRDHLAVVAEFKRRSPSRGALAPTADPAAVARRYRAAGAAAISVLTEPTRFGGDLADLTTIAAAVDLPLLRKDFVVDPRQVVEAANLGASGVLLIVRCLAPQQLAELAAACRELGLDALVEVHDEAEFDRAVAIEDAVIGVNNRDLSTLEIDLTTAPRLLARLPADRIGVAESGYSHPDELAALRGIADAVLVGSALMGAGEPGAALEALRR